MEIAEKYTEMVRAIVYSKENPNKLAEIEDMAGKVRREEKKDRNELRNERKKYSETVNNLREEFKLALFEEYGVNTHPKREQIFSKAWEDGHASGFNEVEIYFSELVELVV